MESEPASGGQERAPLQRWFPDGLPAGEKDEDEQLTTEQKRALLNAYQTALTDTQTPDLVKDLLEDEINRLNAELLLYDSQHLSSE